ncbi:MAG TPA: T9SS type A sorting domain-containing protein [Ignavibacteriaceae bacterium]|nr:T9SS type A sorting domain-containing protein [Ignavibacteriaceae bacterium]
MNDFEPKIASIPPSVNAEKPSGAATVTVTIQGDTLGKISKYIFGNSIAAWAGAHDNPTFVEGVELLAPTLIRFPGGSWSNGYFWNGVPSDVPDSIYDGTTYNSTTKTANKNQFWGQTGKGGWQTTPDQWYALRDAVGTEGLVTVNYAYARYGTSDDPVGQAAHLAADWVRDDYGRTKFWEIGNENGGPWEYGWMIDTALNKDGQPQIITGELYGKHFKVFADSMRKAAAEIGAEIYIGGQIVVYGETSWNFVDRTWNEGFFREVGNSADFYVIHNYFSGQATVNGILTFASTEVKKNMDFIKQDIQKKSASSKPIALTEYNIGFGDDPRKIGTSYVNGMQSVVLFNELIKNNFGMSCRWLLLTGEDALFYGGSDNNYLYHPRPEFYYTIYLQKFTGDHSIAAASSNSDILCYATKFSSGETGVVIVNKNTTEQVISINSAGVGNNYYVYLFTGGTDNAPFSQNVYINGNGPDEYQWGPYNDVLSIPANKYTIENEIKFTSPGNSIQFILLEKGNNVVSSVDEKTPAAITEFKLNQNYPNPFNPETKISYSIPVEEFVTIKVYDILGREVAALVNKEESAGNHEINFNASSLSSGTYIYRMSVGSFGEAGDFVTTKKLMLIK